MCQTSFSKTAWLNIISERDIFRWREYSHSLLTRVLDNVSMIMLDLTFSVSMTIIDDFFDVDWLDDVALENN